MIVDSAIETEEKAQQEPQFSWSLTYVTNPLSFQFISEGCDDNNFLVDYGFMFLFAVLNFGWRWYEFSSAINIMITLHLNLSSVRVSIHSNLVIDNRS